MTADQEKEFILAEMFWLMQYKYLYEQYKLGSVPLYTTPTFKEPDYIKMRKEALATGIVVLRSQLRGWRRFYEETKEHANTI